MPVVLTGVPGLRVFCGACDSTLPWGPLGTVGLSGWRGQLHGAVWWGAGSGRPLPSPHKNPLSASAPRCPPRLVSSPGLTSLPPPVPQPFLRVWLESFCDTLVGPTVTIPSISPRKPEVLETPPVKNSYLTPAPDPSLPSLGSALLSLLTGHRG